MRLTPNRAELRGALAQAQFGLSAAGLLAFPVAVVGFGVGSVVSAVAVLTLPLSLSMGAAEWSLYRYRRPVQELLERCRTVRQFAPGARRVLLGAVLRYLTAAAVLIAVAVAALHAFVAVTSAGTAVGLCVSYLALGGALFVALLLQALGGGAGNRDRLRGRARAGSGPRDRAARRDRRRDGGPTRGERRALHRTRARRGHRARSRRVAHLIHTGKEDQCLSSSQCSDGCGGLHRAPSVLITRTPFSGLDRPVRPLPVRAAILARWSARSGAVAVERGPDSDGVQCESGGVAKDAGRRTPGVPHRPAGRSSAAPSHASGAQGTGTSVGLIALQRSAGNAAVAALLHTPSAGPGLDGPLAVQRCGPAHPDCGCSPEERRAAEAADDTESTEAAPQSVQRAVPGGGGGVEVHLRSARFTPSAKLELCFQDRARLRRGDPDTDAVQRVQEALLALPAKTGRSYDLGEKGADGVYGAKTAAAVVKFKSDEALGSTQFDDVGPGTMRRLDELFASGDGPLPPCPVPLPVATSFADGPGGGAKAKVGLLPIPGVTCQIRPGPNPAPAPTVTDFATIPDAERRRIRIAADSKVPVEFDKRYSTLDKDGSPFQDTHVGTIVFGPGITDQTVQAGLSRVAGALHTSAPPLLPKSRTLEMLVRNGFDKRNLPGVVIPGGVFRFTRFTLGTVDTTLVERIGNIPAAPGPVLPKAAASAALIAKFSGNLVFIDDLVTANQLPVIDAALTLARRAVAQLPQWELDISPGVTKTGEDGIWDTTVPSVDPITQPGVRRGQQLKLFANAFRGGTDLNRPGGQEPAVWTVIHEVGHGIAFANKALVTRFDAALLADGGGRTANPVTDYGAKSGEGFPEALAFFYTDPTILQASRPATFTFMQANF